MVKGVKKSNSLQESFRYAMEGIMYTIRTQRNMRIHIIIGMFVVLFSLYLGVSGRDLAILLILISLVWVAELLNTSIEIFLDFITQKEDKDIKHIKDIQAGIVLVFAVFSVLSGIIIIKPYIYKLFYR